MEEMGHAAQHKMECSAVQGGVAKASRAGWGLIDRRVMATATSAEWGHGVRVRMGIEVLRGIDQAEGFLCGSHGMDILIVSLFFIIQLLFLTSLDVAQPISYMHTTSWFVPNTQYPVV
jgi:hypothetical protein